MGNPIEKLSPLQKIGVGLLIMLVNATFVWAIGYALSVNDAKIYGTFTATDFATGCGVFGLQVGAMLAETIELFPKFSARFKGIVGLVAGFTAGYFWGATAVVALGLGIIFAVLAIIGIRY